MEVSAGDLCSYLWAPRMGSCQGPAKGLNSLPSAAPLREGEVSLWELSLLHHFGGFSWCEFAIPTWEQNVSGPEAPTEPPGASPSDSRGSVLLRCSNEPLMPKPPRNEMRQGQSF